MRWAMPGSLTEMCTAVPKCHTVFRFQVPQPTESEEDAAVNDGEKQVVRPSKPDLVFELYGSQFENRATDRATKKFKQRRMEDL